MSTNSQSQELHPQNIQKCTPSLSSAAAALQTIRPTWVAGTPDILTTNPYSPHATNNMCNNNNNYVDFNQFIMQHNLFGGSNGTENMNSSAIENSANGSVNSSGRALGYTQSSTVAESLQQNNLFNPNSELFPLNNATLSSMYAARIGENYAPATSFGYGDNRSKPPSKTSAPDATNTLFTDPFSTSLKSFDFGPSKLQASAPEFVPRFSYLSLSENNNKATSNGNGNVNGMNIASKQQKQLETANNLNGAAREVPVFDGNHTRSTNNIFKSTESASSSSSSPSVTSTGAVSRSTGATSKKTNGYTPASAVKQEKTRAVREREHDNRRYQSERRAADAHEQQRPADRGDRGVHYEDRENRYERTHGNRYELEERGSYGYHRNNRGNKRSDNHQRYDNYRSNKRHDDWNRNRDRINGFRVEDKYSSENDKDSSLSSPEKKPSPKKTYPESEKLSQREKLVHDIELRRLECLVCVENIKQHQSIWNCQNCYHIFHLQCTVKWASSSKSEEGWRCPACQHIEKKVPQDYYCFCRKMKNPPFNRQEIAHSCGEVCGRIDGCPHACTLLCHPGPCPPCQANVQRECGCGRTTKTMQCCLKEAIECDAICEKLLNCELHACTAKCHEGKCAPCAEKVNQKCHCSKQEREVTCTRDSHDKFTYSCGKPCGKDLSCGNHKCKDCCHPGECRPCKLSPEVITSCPCGKKTLEPDQRKSCLDAIPLCEGVCDKTLRCGKSAHPHHCTSKCHHGNCPPCNKQTAVKCRCGHMDQMIKCRQLSTRADDARCKKRCVKKRSCGKHKCNQECCIDIDHFCPLPCNYTLSCGKHKCDQPCHRGNCPPCYRSSFEELYCECGHEVIYPPVPCGTKRPVCRRPCSRSHLCEHTQQHTCHSAPTCPPCMIFTAKWCFGHHEQRKTIPCSQGNFSCGMPCNKPLRCGRHKCIKTCHDGECQTAGEICKQSCPKLRANCGHKCMAPCHEGDCPETQCKEMVEVQCDCGHRKQMRSCHELAREFSRITTARLASSMAEVQRGNYMELSEILTPAKASKTNKTLDCNEECRLIDRNRRLAIGLQIRNPDLPQKLLTKYSDFIRNFAKRDPTLVKSVHDALTNLVKLAKESKQRSRSHSFPTMNREKRQLVHEMCEMFGVDATSYDAEPNRNVVATAFKDRSWLPATSIMEVIARESGQRRVPVPSNNAWGTKK